MKPVHVWMAVLAVLAATPAHADSRARDAALKKLQDAAKGSAALSTHRATDVVRFVRIPPAARGLGMSAAKTEREKKDQSAAFFRTYGAAMGISDPAGLRHASTVTDRLGETHLTWTQFHGNVPVFAGVVKTHFDAAHKLKAASGTAIPDITVSTTPGWNRTQAAEIALASVTGARGPSSALGLGATKLYVYREGLAQGVPGDALLAWEVEVTDGAGIRDMVYVNAHTGKVIDRISAVHDEMFRRAYDGHGFAFFPKNYPNASYWEEGEPFPTASLEANNMIVSSKEVYDFFAAAFGRDSFDGRGRKMDAIFDRGYSCPNASWNGVFISFCPGATTDDITAHEWGHAYTERTHGLIYQWQSGALNESYSDIWGEVIDSLNTRGFDDPPGSTRDAGGACSVHSPPRGQLFVNSPAAIAGPYLAQSAGFGPPLDATGVTGDVTAVSPANGCTAVTPPAPATGTAVALIDRGTCEFSTKVLNAQNAGYDAVIIANNSATGIPGMGAGVDAPFVTIPSIGVQQSTGAAIRGQLNATPPQVVNATLRAAPGTDDSYRWLMGEDWVSAGGAIRDMWNPNCYSNPGKVTDTAYYICDVNTDAGGVHINSGVPNHAFALLVDGGTYNGRTVASIGRTKAAHVYYRAQSVYQVPDTDFADHATALRSSCADLVGVPLTALTGGPSGETISAFDCDQVEAAIAAVELETPPTFCNHTGRILRTPPPAALCGTGTTNAGGAPVQSVATFGFETAAEAGLWQRFVSTASATFTPRQWEWVDLRERAGKGFFAPNPDVGTCILGSDEAGLLSLVSPEITVPIPTAAGDDFLRATFHHWIATEGGWDGGNLKISVNGGPWQVVGPTEFTFNGYNALLFSAAQGNTNPIAGQPSWTGTNQGNVSGSWGRSDVHLGNFARPGDRIRLRWDLGSDTCSGRIGWYLDDLSLFTCTPAATTIAIADASFDEGNSGTTTRSVTVRLSAPTVRTVAVRYQVLDGTAQHGNDFETGLGGTLIIPANRTTGTISFAVKGDKVSEGDEFFVVRISDPSFGTISDGEATVTIVDDDVVTAAAP